MSINPLSADLDIVQSLVIPGLDDDLDIIQKLDDEPNDVGGLTAAELKANSTRRGTPSSAISTRNCSRPSATR